MCLYSMVPISGDERSRHVYIYICVWGGVCSRVANCARKGNAYLFARLIYREGLQHARIILGIAQPVR